MRVMVQTSEELPVVDEHSILSGGRVGGGGGGGVTLLVVSCYRNHGVI